MNVVFTGHVDHGKSTLVGRLLAETNALPEGKLDKIKKYCEMNSKPFEYAFLLDALIEEQSQGITIDIARCFFKTDKRKYLILDAPGHLEFLKNLVTGAANAEAAFLVIDAEEGIQENTRRHAYMLSLLGISQVVILVNKIDLVNYEEDRFEELKNIFSSYLQKIGLEPSAFIPVSGREGDNIASLSKKMPWYRGVYLLEALDGFHKSVSDDAQPFRMHVQDVYKFTKNNDNRRIIAGQVSSGVLRPGDKVIFFPSGKTSIVKTIEGFNKLPQSFVKAGYSTGFTLQEQVYIQRGEVAAIVGQVQPVVDSRLNVSIFWLGRTPLKQNRIYWFKLGTAKVQATVETIISVINTSSLVIDEMPHEVQCNQAAECVIKLLTPIAFDLVSVNSSMARFVLVDDYDISGGGLIKSHFSDEASCLQHRLYEREQRWVTSSISLEERERRLNQKTKLILLSGGSDPTFRKEIALCLERALFNKGYAAYFIGMKNIKNALESAWEEKHHYSHLENFYQFGEVLNILLNAGLIIVSTVASVTQENINFLQMTTNHNDIVVGWIGHEQNKTLAGSVFLKETDPTEVLVAYLLDLISVELEASYE